MWALDTRHHLIAVPRALYGTLGRGETQEGVPGVQISGLEVREVRVISSATAAALTEAGSSALSRSASDDEAAAVLCIFW